MTPPEAFCRWDKGSWTDRPHTTLCTPPGTSALSWVRDSLARWDPTPRQHVLCPSPRKRPLPCWVTSRTVEVDASSWGKTPGLDWRELWTHWTSTLVWHTPPVGVWIVTHPETLSYDVLSELASYLTTPPPESPRWVVLWLTSSWVSIPPALQRMAPRLSLGASPSRSPPTSYAWVDAVRHAWAAGTCEWKDGMAQWSSMGWSWEEGVYRWWRAEQEPLDHWTEWGLDTVREWCHLLPAPPGRRLDVWAERWRQRPRLRPQEPLQEPQQEPLPLPSLQTQEQPQPQAADRLSTQDPFPHKRPLENTIGKPTRKKRKEN
jgi:hypothetical protein